MSILEQLVEGLKDELHNDATQVIAQSKAEPKSWLESKHERAAVAGKRSSRQVDGWTNVIVKNQKARQQRFGVAQRSQKAITDRLDDCSDDFLDVLESALPEVKVSEMECMQKSAEVLTAENEKRKRENLRKIRNLMHEQSAKAARLKRQKGKRNRRLKKKKLQQEQEKLLQELEQSNPEIVERIKKDYEDERATIRMMAGDKKRRRWARAATKFGAGKLVAEEAARADFEKKSVKEALNRIKQKEEGDAEELENPEEDFEQYSDSYCSDSAEESESEVSVDSDDVERQAPVREVAKMGNPTKTPSVSEVLEKHDIKAKDLTHLLGEAPESSAIIGEQFAQEELAEEMANVLVDADADTAMMRKKIREETELPGWGDWAGDNYVEALDDIDKKVKEMEDDVLKQKRKAPVAVNRKLGKKFAKYFVQDLPAKYKTADAYNVDMATPNGREWNSHEAVVNKVQPRVFIEKGAIILPLEKARETDNLEIQESIISNWKLRNNVRTSVKL